MMKINLRKLGAVVMVSGLLVIMSFGVVMAADSTTGATGSSGSGVTLEKLLPGTSTRGQFNTKATVDGTLPPNPDDPNKGTKDKSIENNVNLLESWVPSLGAVSKLPTGSIESIIAGVISIILGLGGTLAMIALVVAGVMYITAQDNEDMTQTAKKILVYSIVGLIIISVSFAIFTGLSRLVFT